MSNTTDDINYFPNSYQCGTNDNPDVGLVNMTMYNLWLASYGMTMPTGTIANTSCKPCRRNGQDQIVALERNVVHTAWLRWLLPRQTIVKDLERDAVGLKHLTYGNGIEAIYQRSKEGALARIAYRDPRLNNADQQRSAALEGLLGISQGVAATANTVTTSTS